MIGQEVCVLVQSTRREGVSVSVFSDMDKLYSSLYDYVKENWYSDEEIPTKQKRAIREFYQDNDGETYYVEKRTVE